MKTIINGILRHVLTSGGGGLVAKGYLDGNELEALAGALITIVGVVFSILAKRNPKVAQFLGGHSIAAEHDSIAGPRGTLPTLLLAPLFIGLWLLQVGCTAVDASADPVVVHAERTASYALDTFDSFLKYEFENRALINDAAVKKAADDIRRGAPGWIADLRAATTAYKATRSKADADRLQVALTVVQTAVEIARKHLTPRAGPISQYQFVPHPDPLPEGEGIGCAPTLITSSSVVRLHALLPMFGGQVGNLRYSRLQICATQGTL